LLLSHPPYHKCIVYSNLDGDLSRHADLASFAVQARLVAAESRSAPARLALLSRSRG